MKITRSVTADGAQLVSWSTKPANFDTLKFKAPSGNDSQSDDY